jgi:hypothetical protein
LKTKERRKFSPNGGGDPQGEGGIPRPGRGGLPEHRDGKTGRVERSVQRQQPVLNRTPPPPRAGNGAATRTNNPASPSAYAKATVDKRLRGTRKEKKYEKTFYNINTGDWMHE